MSSLSVKALLTADVASSGTFIIQRPSLMGGGIPSLGGHRIFNRAGSLIGTGAIGIVDGATTLTATNNTGTTIPAGEPLTVEINLIVARETAVAINPSACEKFGASPTATAAVNTVAINLALANGGVVTLNTPGTYNVTAVPSAIIGGNTGDGSTPATRMCLMIGSNTKFIVGPGVVIFSVSGTNAGAWAGTGTGVHVITNSDWTNGNVGISIEGGGIFDGNRAGNSAANDGYYCVGFFLRVSISSFTNITWRGANRGTTSSSYGEPLQLRASNGNVVQGCKASDCTKDGIKLAGGSSFNTVVGNILSNCDAAGIQIAGGSAPAPSPFANCLHNTIVGNTVTAVDSAPPGDRKSGIRIHSSNLNLVVGNTCQFVNTGLDVLGSSAQNHFVGNTCTLGNTQNTNLPVGILIRDSFEGLTSNQNSFIGNTIIPAGSATSGTSVHLTLTTNNLFSGNLFLQGTWTASYTGAFFAATATGNRFMGNAWPGLFQAWTDSGSGNVELTWAGANLGINNKFGSSGGMTGGIVIGNTTTAPATNPVGGGDLYVEAGTLKYKGPSGTVTSLGLP